MAKLRLDKYLADMQLGTRSEVKEYIRKNRIKVDGNFVKTPDYKIDTENQSVTFDGADIAYVETEYYMLNKPAGVLSAANDKKAKTVVDLIETKNRKDLFPVGRLDKDTEGLLLITNDGVLTHNLLAPKKHVDKVYYAKVRGIIGQDVVSQFKQGLKIHEDFTALPANLEIISSEKSADTDEDMTNVHVTIHEGKFHQIKKMFEAVGSEVLYLERLSFGPLDLDPSLERGSYRKLTEQEIQILKSLQ